MNKQAEKNKKISEALAKTREETLEPRMQSFRPQNHKQQVKLKPKRSTKKSVP